MSRNPSQKQMILEFLQRNGHITPKAAEINFGCMRLAARIKELRDEGHVIRMVKESGTNRYGKKMSYAVYFLEDTANEQKEQGEVCEIVQ